MIGGMPFSMVLAFLVMRHSLRCRMERNLPTTWEA